ncbi:MAG: exo-beta-N-acetylmuramidase NamZ domain-containing protein [Lewinella sp.]
MAKVGIFFCFLLAITANCSNSTISDQARTQVQGEKTEEPAGTSSPPTSATPPARPAAWETKTYVPQLRGKRVALVVNQTSTIGGTHLVDSLQSLGLDIKKIFAPEHGFRGGADAGATIHDGIDVRSGLPIKSLHGKNKKPSVANLADVDVIIFDIQDVGARFYTYISTLFYVMEAAAEQGKTVMVLDRPNPNGHYTAGRTLNFPSAQSFIGIAPIPVVHGMTVGEFARMVNGEGWLAGGVRSKLEVISMPGYDHHQAYELPIPPSPNLPNQHSIYLYPSLCFFEGTAVSAGRGTRKQFQLYGHPKLRYGDIRFTPTPGPGSADPKLNGELCRGVDLSKMSLDELYKTEWQLEHLLRAYRDLTDQGIKFFTRPDHFDLLAGGPELRTMIKNGNELDQILASMVDNTAAFTQLRAPYLLYP